MVGMVMVMVMVLLGRLEFVLGIGGVGFIFLFLIRYDWRGDYSFFLGIGLDEVFCVSFVLYKKWGFKE